MLPPVPAMEAGARAVSGGPHTAVGHRGDATAMGGRSVLRDAMSPQVHAKEEVQAVSGGPHTATGHLGDATATGGLSALRDATSLQAHAKEEVQAV